tara:strand:- start:324 stop:623 length:300 start_codon:yes stop_codon:yes gene_type:complete
MILSIRSLKELSLIAKSRDNFKIKSRKTCSNESRKNKKSKDNNLIDLPSIPNSERRKWVKSKEVLSRLFDELDYNNQIQSSYDLTLLERQRCQDKNNVA